MDQWTTVIESKYTIGDITRGLGIHFETFCYGRKLAQGDYARCGTDKLCELAEHLSDFIASFYANPKDCPFRFAVSIESADKPRLVIFNMLTCERVEASNPLCGRNNPREYFLTEVYLAFEKTRFKDIDLTRLFEVIAPDTVTIKQ